MLTILIGNSDDKLSQSGWSSFAQRTRDIVRTYATKIHFQGFSNSDTPYQNAAWVIEIDDRNAGNLLEALRTLRKQYNQDSIAFIQGKTEFI